MGTTVSSRMRITFDYARTVVAMAEVHTLLERCVANGYVPTPGILKKIGLILSANALTNWRDVAGDLGYSSIEIDGYYENLRRKPGDPGLSVVRNWLSKGGSIARLYQVFKDRELNSCLDELKTEMEAFLEELEHESYRLSTRNSNVTMTNVQNVTAADDEARCRDPSTCNRIPEANDEGPRLLFRYVERPPFDDDTEISPPPTQNANRGILRRLFHRSKSCNGQPQRSPNAATTKLGRLLGVRVKTKNNNNSETFVRTNSAPPETSSRTQMEQEGQQGPEFSPIAGANASPSGSTPPSPGPLALDSAQPPSISSAAGCLDDETDANRRNSASSVDSQESSTSRRGTGESGYASEERCEPAVPLTLDSSLRIFIISHEDNSQGGQRLHEFFKDQCECHFYQLECQQMAISMPFNYMVNNLKEADFVLICLSAKLKEVLDAGNESDDSCGMADQIDQTLTFALTQMLGEIGSKGKNPHGKYMPVLFNRKESSYVPYSLIPWMCYNWPKHQESMIKVMNDARRKN